VHPILFTIGKVSIPTYTVLLDLGLILGLVVAYFEGRRILGDGGAAPVPSAAEGLDVGLWVIVGGIVGGRIGFVLANWPVFSEDWLRAVRIWEGGLAFHGAVLGGLAVLILVGLVQGRSSGGKGATLLGLGDMLVPGLALGLAFGWAACLLDGSAYGVMGEGWGYLLLPDLYGVEAPRFATQIAGLGLALILLILFWLLRKRWPFRGAALMMLGLIYFTAEFFLQSTRGDEAIYVGGWRLAQVFDLALAVLAAGGLLVLWWRARGEAIGVGDGDSGKEGVEPGEGSETWPGLVDQGDAS
jgi:phosphatidylglycerol:prolipoprotein diacylglycerol transferase